MRSQAFFGAANRAAILRWYADIPVPMATTNHSRITSADINSRMPRDEVEAVFNKIKPLGKANVAIIDDYLPRSTASIALKIDPKLSVDVMGSFRRCAFCLFNGFSYS